MRTLEILLALVLLIRIILPLFHRGRWIEWGSLAALSVMALHLIFEGYRWQMIPLYGITLWLSAIAFWRLSRPESQATSLSRKRFAATILGVSILGIALILPILLPIPRTPEPTGPNDIGTMTVVLIDESREELYAGETGEPRTIVVQIWYPAELEPDDTPAPWLDHMEVMGPALAAKLNLPSFFLDHVKYSNAYAVADAAVSGAESQYPLLLFSHGWGGFKAQNTFQVEELASHGYIVAAPDHTYGSIATVLPDGRVALNNPEALPVGTSLSDEDILSAAQVLGDQWSGDLSYILDSLENLEPDKTGGYLANHLDFTRVGVLGHSAGGGAAIQFCGSDERCQIALGMDPFMDPVSYQIQNQGLEQPYLAIFSESWAKENGRNNTVFDIFFSNGSGDGYQFYIEETEHYDFTDMPAFSPLAPYLGLKGTLDGEQVSKIINTYTLAFFDQYFKGETRTILDQPAAEFPEMIYLP
jgi:predicted dienelactone hydrolase